MDEIHYTATATREGRLWLIDIDGVGLTQSRTLAKAHDMAVDLIAMRAKVDADSISVTITPALPAAVSRKVTGAQKSSEAAADAQKKASKAMREAVRLLTEDVGLTGADAATVLGLSTQRVSQLIND